VVVAVEDEIDSIALEYRVEQILEIKAVTRVVEASRAE